MTYSALASFAQTAGLLFFIALFAGVVVYALWPGNKKKFDAAARIPLDDETPPVSKNPFGNAGDRRPCFETAPSGPPQHESDVCGLQNSEGLMVRRPPDTAAVSNHEAASANSQTVSKELAK